MIELVAVVIIACVTLLLGLKISLDARAERESKKILLLEADRQLRRDKFESTRAKEVKPEDIAKLQHDVARLQQVSNALSLQLGFQPPVPEAGGYVVPGKG